MTKTETAIIGSVIGLGAGAGVGYAMGRGTGSAIGAIVGGVLFGFVGSLLGTAAVVTPVAGAKVATPAASSSPFTNLFGNLFKSSGSAPTTGTLTTGGEGGTGIIPDSEVPVMTQADENPFSNDYTSTDPAPVVLDTSDSGDTIGDIPSLDTDSFIGTHKFTGNESTVDVLYKNLKA
jgi:hypothetical protein